MNDKLKDELLNSFVVGEMNSSTYMQWVNTICNELKNQSNEQICVQWSKTPILQCVELIWAEQGISVSLMFDTESQTSYLVVGNVLYENKQAFEKLPDINGLIVAKSIELSKQFLDKIEQV